MPRRSLGFVSKILEKVVVILTGRDVTDDGDLGGELHVGDEKGAKEGRDRTLPQPCMYGIEYKLIATVSIPD
jgi:hypothetical protein